MPRTAVRSGLLYSCLVPWVLWRAEHSDPEEKSMQEVDLENIIVRYPDIIEPNLTLLARQSTVYGKRPDLLFRDGSGCKLVVEVKIGALCRTDVGQLSEYCHYLFMLDGLRPRGMLVGTWVPKEIRGAAEFAGFECRAVTLDDLEKLVSERGDQEMLDAVRGRGSSGGAAKTERHLSAARGRDRLGATAGSISSSSGGRAPSGPLSARPSIADMLRAVLADVPLHRLCHLEKRALRRVEERRPYEVGQLAAARTSSKR